MLAGFIPISFKNKNITYTIYSYNIASANTIKEELILFYKEYCYSSLFVEIDKKIAENIGKFTYKATYHNKEIVIKHKEDKIKMTGYLYKIIPSSIEYEYYFNASTYSMPEAISNNVATSTQSETT